MDARKGLIIRKNAVIAYEAVIWSLNHDYNDKYFCGKGALTEIGDMLGFESFNNTFELRSAKEL